MRAMILDGPRRALRAGELPNPRAGAGQLELRVLACGVCRTDLHVWDGDLADPKLPLVLGHEIVGTVAAIGDGVTGFTVGQRVGVPWLGSTCGSCEHCLAGRENLCDQARFTGYHVDGGFAERTVADARYCFPIDRSFDAAHAAPLLCAGLIGHRAFSMVGDARRIGIYGFGAAAHILIQVARWSGREIYAFTRAGDVDTQRFAMELGAQWAGSSEEAPPQPLDAAILFAPVGALVPKALANVRKGGVVVCAGIHMSDVPSFPYSLLWGERTVRSVANLTRRDGLEFLALARTIPIHTEVTTFGLDEANEAMQALRGGAVRGAAVLLP